MAGDLADPWHRLGLRAMRTLARAVLWGLALHALQSPAAVESRLRNDHLGTPQRITDKSGAVIWAADYDAYGKAITRTTVDAAKAITNNLRYPGQYWDDGPALQRPALLRP